MKVSIEHGELKEGMIKKTTYFTVSVTIAFTDEEREIIEKRGLRNTVLYERGIPANKSAGGYNNELQIAKGALSTAINIGKGLLDAEDIRVLRISTLLKGKDTFTLATPSEAKTYEENLKAALVVMKGYIMDNAGIENKSTSFEL